MSKQLMSVKERIGCRYTEPAYDQSRTFRINQDISLKAVECDAMNHPILTICMPVWNGEDFIRQAIHSITTQRYQNFKLLISDNNSDDSTESICRTIAATDTRITYVKQQKNLGSIGNFRFLAERCDTPLIMYAAHDDLWDRSWLERLLPQALKPNTIPSGTVKYIDEYGHSTRGIERKFTYDSGCRLMRRMSILWNLFPHHLYGILKTEELRGVFHDVFGQEINEVQVYLQASDVYLVYQLGRYNRLTVDNSCTRYVRLHGSNAKEIGKVKVPLSPVSIIRDTFTTVSPVKLMRLSTIPECAFILPVCSLIVCRNWANLLIYAFNKLIRVFKTH
jgi:glycosyltransferase involved in cell wall biosynthesis